MTFCSARIRPALFHAGSAHGLSTFRGFPLAAADTGLSTWSAPHALNLLTCPALHLPCATEATRDRLERACLTRSSHTPKRIHTPCCTEQTSAEAPAHRTHAVEWELLHDAPDSEPPKRFVAAATRAARSATTEAVSLTKQTALSLEGHRDQDAETSERDNPGMTSTLRTHRSAPSTFVTPTSPGQPPKRPSDEDSARANAETLDQRSWTRP